MQRPYQDFLVKPPGVYTVVRKDYRDMKFIKGHFNSFEKAKYFARYVKNSFVQFDPVVDEGESYFLWRPSEYLNSEDVPNFHDIQKYNASPEDIYTVYVFRGLDYKRWYVRRNLLEAQRVAAKLLERILLENNQDDDVTIESSALDYLNNRFTVSIEMFPAGFIMSSYDTDWNIHPYTNTSLL